MDISDDVVIYILSFLSIKEIILFRNVCKSIGNSVKVALETREILDDTTNMTSNLLINCGGGIFKED